MKFLFAILTSLLFFVQSDLEAVRSKYITAHQTKQNADSFVKLTQNAGNSSTMAGYKAAAKIVQAKFAVGDGRKKIITSGIRSLESTVNNDSDNAELRVIRMSVQENLPKFIKYNTNLSSDKSFLLKNYSKQSTALKAYIKKFAAQSRTFTAADRASLK